MKIHHQGWNDTVGAFNSDVTIEETKCDYEILFANGMVYRQCTPFADYITNQDPTGTIHYKLGAYFDCNGSREFFTPQELASLALNGYAVIPGLQIEDRQENLADRIQAAERRAKALARIQTQAPIHAISAPHL